tara:strand:+ start:286 stop:843 length:558 start_codon:yes stop_codon:yes gene_type:complete
MRKDFYDFDHNQNILDLTEELNFKIKALNPNINIKLLDNDSEESEYTGTIGLTIEYNYFSEKDFNNFISNIPSNWDKKPDKELPMEAFWSPDKHSIDFFQEFIKDSKEYYKNHELDQPRIGVTVETPNIETEKGKRFPEKRFNAFIDIALEATATTKFGLKLSLWSKIETIIDELNSLDRDLRRK